MADINILEDLRNEREKRFPKDHFFDPDTLKFFGERLSDMRLLKTKETITDILGKQHLCYVVSCTQKHPYGCGYRRRRKYHYFDTTTLEDVILP